MGVLSTREAAARCEGPEHKAPSGSNHAGEDPRSEVATDKPDDTAEHSEHDLRTLVAGYRFRMGIRWSDS
jgi:hypothetical protein